MSSRPSGPRKGQRPSPSGRIANEQRLLALGDAVDRRHIAVGRRRGGAPGVERLVGEKILGHTGVAVGD